MPINPIQNLSTSTLTGNEAWVAGIGGPQGPVSFFLTTAQMRNSTGILTTATTSGTIVTTTNTSNLVFTTAAAGVTVDLPPNPYDGEIFEVVNGSAGAFTGTNVVASTDGSTVNAATIGTLGANASKEWRYAASTNTWYLMR
jgi:hypothetical protein